MTCPICKAPSVGTKPCPGYCEGVEDGRAHEWCALDYCGIPRCIRCGVPNKLSVLRNFPYCPKMGAAERALLERDVAEVERAADELRDFVALTRRGLDATPPGYGNAGVLAVLLGRLPLLEAELADCEAWLVRARAALGGSR